MKLLTIAAVTCVVVYSLPAQAAPTIKDCDKALSQSYLKEASSIKSDWRLSTLVTQEQWSEQKQGANATGAIYGVPIGASYEDFKKNSQKFYSEHNESLNINVTRSVAWQGLQSTNVDAYKACLSALRSSNPGIYLAVAKQTQNQISLTAFYNAGPSDPDDISIAWDDSSKLLGKRAPDKLHRHTEIGITLARPTSGEALVGVSQKASLFGQVSVAGDTLIVEPVSPMPPPIWKLHMSQVDDELSCSVNGSHVATIGFGSDQEFDISYLVKGATNRIDCQGKDINKAFGRYPCWSFSYVVTRDNIPVARDVESKCYDGAPSQPGQSSRNF